MVDDKNNIIKIFMSYHEAAREELGKNEASPIRVVCNGSQFSVNGKIFRDLDENNQPIVPIQKTRKRKTPIYGVSINDKMDIVYYESVSEAARQQNCSR